MERLLVLALAATLLSAVPALAQNQGQNAGGATEAAQAGADPLDPGVEVSLGRTEIKQ